MYEVKELVGEIKDPIIDVPLKETEAICRGSLKEKEHVSVKLAMTIRRIASFYRWLLLMHLKKCVKMVGRWI